MFCSAATMQWSHTGQKASDQALGTGRRCGGASQRGTGNYTDLEGEVMH